MKKIQVFDYLRQYKDIEAKVLSAINIVLNSGALILGEQVKSFEDNFCNYLGDKGYAVAVNSGTDALVVALRALNIGHGDEVITLSNTAVPTVSAIRIVGATPVFCDVNESDALIRIDQILDVITDNTKAIIPVHLFGNVVDINEIKKITDDRGISIIEDCAQAIGSKINNKMAGTLGKISAFSFYPTKNLGAYGDAGLCYTQDPLLAKKMREIRMYGFDSNNISKIEGINSRMDELQAAILNVKLEYVDSYIYNRRELAEEYDKFLNPSIIKLSESENLGHSYHLYVVRVPDRELVIKKLSEVGIGSGIHYKCPIHLMSGYEFLGYSKGSLRTTELLSGEILSLPMYPELTKKEVRFVCKNLNSILSQI
jgi:dTDP-3-amino-2,3,6-trideoxy-4-keto-D-glucose/dTDP-3-amino-3,4,6-trideoxy-alpha-D-glucose/dTDP-2,6-dideoxy-D-kanosamine transaminase